MYVVIEWNQASQQPSVADDEVYHDLGDARRRRDWLAEQTATLGRRERYEVFALDEIEV